MTRRTNARIAGITFLVYFAVAFPAMLIDARATRGASVPERLATIAQHTAGMRISVLLGVASVFCALVLAVTLYGITRDEDHELAMLGLVCRAGEGIVGASPAVTLGLLSLATDTGLSGSNAAGAPALAAFLLELGNWQVTTAATLFAAGSTIFAVLLLRGRMIPTALAWLGILGSVLILIELPMELAGLIPPPTQLIWIPIALFELTVALWFIIKGVAPPRTVPD